MSTRLLPIFLSLLFLPQLMAGQEGCIDPQQIDTGVICPGVVDPVCGCDGQEYQNACEAQYWYGVTSWAQGPCSEACGADFLFSHLQGSTFHFISASTNYDSLSWSIAGEAYEEGTQQSSIFAELPADTAEVCITVWNAAGCSDTRCRTVFAGAPDELCNTTDCILPGDANGDRLANNYDLPNIGFGYGLQGPERELLPDPDNPLLWVPNYGDDWQEEVNGVDFKHADCDGDGLIDEADVEAINVNYFPDFEVVSEPVQGAPPVYIQFDTASIVIDEDSPDYITFSAGIYVGTEELPVQQLHSLSFYLEYPYELTVPHSITISYEPASFLGAPQEMLEVQRDLADHEVGRYDLAWSRRNTNGEGGYGRIATANFIISSDIIEGRAVPETPFPVSISGAVLFDDTRDTLYHDELGQVELPIIDATVTSLGGPDMQPSGLQLFPNPASSLVQYRVAGGARAQRLQLCNAQGQVVRQTESVEDAGLISLQGLKPGLYYMSVWTDEGRFTQKLMVN